MHTCLRCGELEGISTRKRCQVQRSNEVFWALSTTMLRNLVGYWIEASLKYVRHTCSISLPRSCILRPRSGRNSNIAWKIARNLVSLQRDAKRVVNLRASKPPWRGRGHAFICGRAETGICAFASFQFIISLVIYEFSGPGAGFGTMDWGHFFTWISGFNIESFKWSVGYRCVVSQEMQF
jgi:hypothetical protein